MKAMIAKALHIDPCDPSGYDWIAAVAALCRAKQKGRSSKSPGV